MNESVSAAASWESERQEGLRLLCDCFIRGEMTEVELYRAIGIPDPETHREKTYQRWLDAHIAFALHRTNRMPDTECTHPGPDTRFCVYCGVQLRRWSWPHEILYDLAHGLRRLWWSLR